jgi:glycosyl transferase family 25
MKKTDLGIDKIYVINLPKRQDRRDEVESELSRLEYHYINAIDGMEIDIPKLILNGTLNESFYDPKGMVNKNVVACALSHRKSWETFVDSQEETCLILEDDVFTTRPILKDSYSENYDKPSEFWDDMMFQLGGLDWDVVYLGKKTQYVDGIDTTPLFCIPFYGAGGWGAHSYLINKKSAKKLLKLYNPIKYAVDVFLDVMIDELNVYSVKESSFRQRGDIYIEKKLPEKVDSDTFHNSYYKGSITSTHVDNTVESTEFTNYRESVDFEEGRGFIKLNFRKR